MTNTFRGYLLLVLLSLSIYPNLFAQSTMGYINGFITDTLTNEAIPFANVFIPYVSTKNGVVSNENGFYTLELPEGEHQIRVTYVGYKDKTISVNVLANETTTQNLAILQHSVQSRPPPGKEIEGIYGHWKVKCAELDDEKIKPNKYEKSREKVGIYFTRFPNHETGVGTFGYNDGCGGRGRDYFRYDEEGKLNILPVMQEVILLGCHRDNRVYTFDNMSKLYDGYTVTFESSDKIIIENDEIKMTCMKVD